MYICIYVYMYICIYVYMYICIYIYYMYIYILYVYIYIYYVYMYICIYVYMYICIYIICIYIYNYLFLFDALSCSCDADTSFITWGQQVSIQPFGLWAWQKQSVGNGLQGFSRGLVVYGEGGECEDQKIRGSHPPSS